MDKFAGDVARLFAPPDVEASERLQLLTIHKAKGLEFDTVICPGLGRSTRSESRSLMLTLEYIDPAGATQLLLAPIQETGGVEDALYAYLRSVESMKREHESTRLLYVAATRGPRASASACICPSRSHGRRNCSSCSRELAGENLGQRRIGFQCCVGGRYDRFCPHLSPLESSLLESRCSDAWNWIGSLRCHRKTSCGDRLSMCLNPTTVRCGPRPSSGPANSSAELAQWCIDCCGNCGVPRFQSFRGCIAAGSLCGRSQR